MFSDDDEEFSTPHFRMAKLASPQRRRQMGPHSISFGLPPRTDSMTALDSELKQPLPKRSASSGIASLMASVEAVPFDLDADVASSAESLEPLDREKIMEKLTHFLGDPPEHLKEATNRLIEGRNQKLVDIIDKEAFAPLSSILQVHKTKKALMIVPSNNLVQWVRSFLADSTSMCPEGMKEQQKMLGQIKIRKVHVLICLVNRLTTLPLDNFDFICVVRSELCESILPTIAHARGTIILMESPGYNTNVPFSHVVTKDPALVPKCQPVAYFDTDCYSKLDEVIDIEEATCVIAPMKNSCDKAFKAISNKAVRFSNMYSRKDEAAVVVATTALLYTPARYDHYIFVEFPPSLGHLLMACYTGSRVTVLVSDAMAAKLQAFSHGRGWDQSSVANVLQSLFWNGNSFRTPGQIGSISIEGLDVTKEAAEEMIAELVQQNAIERLPCTWKTIQMRIVTMGKDLTGSDLINTVINGRPNQYGQYVAQMQHLCDATGLSPLQIEFELQKFADKGSLSYKYLDEASFFLIKKKFEDDEEYMEYLADVSQALRAREDRYDHAFDVAYTILVAPDELTPLAEKGAPDNMNPIPHTPVNSEDIKKLLTHVRRAEWTPRAVARVLHGMSSPKFDATEFSKTPYWGSQVMSSFKEVMKFCQRIACNPARI